MTSEPGNFVSNDHSLRTKVLIGITGVLVLAGIVYWVTQQPRDPFAGIEAKSYGTEGKIRNVEENIVTFDAAISSVKNGVTYINYEERKAVITGNTKILRKAGKSNEPAELADLSVNSMISVTTDKNTNSNVQFDALEIIVH